MSRLIRLPLYLLVAGLLTSCAGLIASAIGPHKRPDKVMTIDSASRTGNHFKLGKGTYGTLDLRQKLPATPTTVVIEGAGKDETVIDTDVMLQANRAAHTFIIKNLSVIEPRVGIPETTIVFVNVKVVGKLDDYAYQSYSSSDGARISFLLCDFEDFQGNNAWFIGPSMIESKGEWRPAMKLSHDLRINMKDAADTWWKAGGDFTKQETKFAFYEAMRMLQAAAAEADISADARSSYEALSKIAKEHGEDVFQVSASAQNVASAKSFLTKARGFSKQSNHLLASYALNKARELGGNNIPGLKTALQKNKAALSERYGCDVTLEHNDDTPSTYIAHPGGRKPDRNFNKQHAKDTVENILKDVSPLFTAMGTPDSRCKFELISNVDHFIGEDTGRQVVSQTPSFIESSASQMRRAELKRAAADAAWKSAYARTDAAVNQLTSVTKQLHENRNSIESRSGGTYLVLNNAGINDTGYADRQTTYDAAAAAKQAQELSRATGREFIQSGVDVTSTFYMSFKDAYQVDMKMTGVDGQEALYSPKLAIKTKSVGPCTAKSNTQGIGVDITGPCEDLVWGYRHDKEMRESYVHSRLEPPLLEFLSGHVIKPWVSEIQEKSRSMDKSTKLDGLLLSYLIGQNEKNLDIRGLSQEVLGEAISLQKLKDYSLY